LTPIECKYQIVLVTLLVFIDASENLIMANDVVMLSNLLYAPIEEEELKETPFDVNVTQRSRKKKLSKRVVCTRVNWLTWYCQLFPNPHALIIYLEFVPAREVALKRFEKC
jgi:hypothetical protein